MFNQIINLPYKYLTAALDSNIGKRVMSGFIPVTITLIAIVVFYSFPSYDIALLTNEMESGWKAIFLQGEKPFVHIPYGSGSHEEKLAFRFIPAVLLNIIGCKTILSGLIFQFFTLIVFYILLVLNFYSHFKDWRKTFVYCLPICFVISGHVYVSDYRGFFDTLALDFLLLSLLFRNYWFSIITLLLAFYTDERSIVASPAIAIIALVNSNYLDKKVLNIVKLKPIQILVISWLLYLVIRFILISQVGLQPAKGRIDYFFEQIHLSFYTFYIGLEGFIIPLFIIGYHLIKNKKYTFLLLFFTSFFLVYFVAQSVFDINRSMSYLILFLISLLLLVEKLKPQETAYRIISWVIVISILYDDFYPLVLQIIRMKFITHTI